MLELLRRMFDHMYWADEGMLAVLSHEGAAGIDAVRLAAHIIAAEQVWLARLTAAEAAPPVWPDWTRTEVVDAARVSRAGYERLLAALTDEALDRIVVYRNSAGRAFETRAIDILTHVALHGSYHRGQIMLTVRRAGGEPANTDFITYVREARSP